MLGALRPTCEVVKDRVQRVRLRGKDRLGPLEVAAAYQRALPSKIFHPRVDGQLAESLVVIHERQRGLHRRPQRCMCQRVCPVFRGLTRRLQGLGRAPAPLIGALGVFNPRLQQVLSSQSMLHFAMHRSVD